MKDSEPVTLVIANYHLDLITPPIMIWMDIIHDIEFGSFMTSLLLLSLS